LHRIIRNLYIVAFIMIIIFVSGGYHHYYGTHDQLLTISQKKTALSGQTLSEEISGWLAKHTHTIESAGNHIALHLNSDDDILAYLASLKKHNEEFESIYFATLENEMIKASGRKPPAKFNAHQSPWYSKALEKNRTILTDAYTNNASQSQTIFTIATPVYSADHQLLGVVGGDLSVEQIGTLLNSAEIKHDQDEGAFSVLIDGKGSLLTHPDQDNNPQAELKTFEEKYGSIENKASEIEDGVFRLETSDTDGYMAYLPIRETGWHLATFIPISGFTESSSQFGSGLFFTLTASLLTAALFLIYHHAYVYKPLAKFESDLKKIDLANNLSYRLPEYKNSELAILGRTFNKLLEKAQNYFSRLQENKDELKKANDELEHLIRRLTTAEEALDYSEEKLYYLSYHDQLTGLHNRAYFEAKLNFLGDKPEYPITIISADIDGLKLINDTMGHNTGDQLLKACADILKETFSSTGILCRVGGDEFNAILPLSSNREGECLARQIRHQVAFYNQHNADLPLSLSLGVATAEESGTSLNKLFKQADDFMFRDKLHRSKSARNGIVQSLIAALTEKDPLIGSHIERLEKLGVAFGERISLNSRQMSNLILLAQVHDLGKVSISDDVLLKPGPLTDEEWEIMKQHPAKGSRIASSSPDLAGIANLILSHQEKWDGSGYPLGLKGPEIPLECRILSILDAYDIMTSERAHRQAINSEAAYAELERNAGTQFDPELIHVFLNLMFKKQA